MLKTIRPSRLFLGTLAIPALLLPLAGYVWMRAHYSFLMLSVGLGRRQFSEVGAWISVGVGAALLYAIPASLVFWAVRRRESTFRNSALLLTLLVFLVGLGVWLEVQRA